MNSVNNGVNLKEEVKEMCFEVSMWWYELHGGKVKVNASSQEEAVRLVKENMSEYIELAKKSQETYSGSNGEEGIDDAIVAVDKEKNENKIYRDRFDTDVYVITTSYHSYGINNILEIGRVKYSDYMSEDSLPYKFSESNSYNERFDYYKLGACPRRSREEVIFEKEDYKKLLLKSLFKVKDEYAFAKNIDEALDEGKYILMIEKNNSTNRNLIKTLQVRAVKIEKESERVPFKIYINDHMEMKFSNINEIKKTILHNQPIYASNSLEFSLYLNTKEGLSRLNDEVIKSIGYTFE